MKNKLKICSVIVAIIVVAVAAIIIANVKIPSSPQQPTNDTTDSVNEEETKIDLTCGDVTMFVDDEYAKLNVNVTCNKDYTLTYEYDKSAIKLIDDKVYPIKSGTFDVLAEVATSDKSLSKTFLVTVYPTVEEVSFTVSCDEVVDKVFVGESYSLSISTDVPLHGNFTIHTSDNIESFTEVEGENLKFNFTVASYDETWFEFEYRNYSKHFDIDCYEYISDFEISFSNSYQNNMLSLFLFDSNQSDMANSDGKYMSTNFKVAISQHCLPLYDVIVADENIVSFEQDKITAKGIGETTLQIVATDGSGHVENIDIVVEEIHCNTLTFSTNEITLEVGDSMDFSYTFSPSYALNNIVLEYDEGILVEGTKVTAVSEGSYQIVVKDEVSKLKDVLTVIVSKAEEAPPYHYEIKFSDSFLSLNNATFEDNILTIDSDKKDIEIALSYAITSENGEYSGSIETKINVTTSIGGYEIEHISNSVSIITSNHGEMEITLSLNESEYQIYYTFKVIIK